MTSSDYCDKTLAETFEAECNHENNFFVKVRQPVPWKADLGHVLIPQTLYTDTLPSTQGSHQRRDSSFLRACRVC